VLHRVRSRLHGQEGFTLIELLVVILIIGILAAIAIPSFLNQKGKGEDAVAKSAAKTGETTMETFYTDNNTYDCAATCDAQLHGIEPTLPTFGTGNGQMSIVSPSTTGYEVKVVSNSSGRTFSIVKNGGTSSHTCVVPAGANNGGCKNVVAGAGTW
jgi:type IV pilus assembly protein PilA